MAAGIPQEEALELLQLYAAMLTARAEISELDYWQAVKKLEKLSTCNSIRALGILHAVAGKYDKMIDTFEKGLEFNDDIIARNYCFVLRNTNKIKQLRYVSYLLADKHGNKFLTDQAVFSAYRFGDREELVRYFDMHIRLLSDDEGRDMALKHKAELLSELDDAFESSGCTKNQFDKLAGIIWEIVDEFHATTGFVELSKNSNNCYIVDIKDKTPSEIANMNFALAEAVCMEPELDDCELIARFSAPRILHTGVSYELKQC